eukprot:SAG11_NODE_3461_length_2434_cov_1.295931_3_plen_155_part_01
MDGLIADVRIYNVALDHLQAAAVPALRAAAPTVYPRVGEHSAVQLFNGTDLSGWNYTEKFWSVRDGVIIGKSHEPVLTSTYCLTKAHYTDFRLVCRVRYANGKTTKLLSVCTQKSLITRRLRSIRYMHRRCVQVKLQESEMHSGICFWGHVPPPQ